MPDLAKQFTKDEIERALDHILENRIEMTPSTKHDLLYKDHLFAPKEVVRWAARLSKLENWESYNLSGGENTNKPLRDLGFKIVAKDTKEASYFDKVAISELQERNNKKIQDSTLNKLDYLKDQLASELNVQLSDSDFYYNKKNDYLDIGFNTLENHSNNISVILGFFGSEEESEDDFFRLCVESKDGDFIEEVHRINENYKFGFDYDDFPDDWESLIDQLIIPFENILKVLPKSSIMPAEKNQKNQQPLNQILYGPPGTGKTYNTINKAIAIANPYFNLDQDRKIVKAEYERLMKEGRVSFVTFHQSMSYEDFIEGIKPQTKNEQVTYSVKDGIFKNMVKMALSEYVKSTVQAAPEKDDFDRLYDSFVENIKPLEGVRQGTFTTKTGIELMLVLASSNSIQVKYLWDNNKTKYKEANHIFTVSKQKLKKVLQEGINPSQVKSLAAELHPLIGHIHCELFAVYKKLYDFVVENKGDVETVYFDYEDQSFDEVKEQFDVLNLESIVRDGVKPYILIIDEINRGNVSQIFGELITLIEEDKRIGNDEVIQVTLPYSKTKCGVPKNLFIIGTMNTADKSVEALDAALRRRFVFHEMPPKYEELESNYQNVFNYSAVDILKTINERIEVLLNRDHLLGHAYFINKNAEALMQSFQKNIIPLLQEYFYGDYAKIGLVLGNGFIQPKPKAVRFANFTTQTDFDSYTDQELYEIKPVNNLTDFEQALVQLMN